MKINKISLIMPVYNEEKTLKAILDKILLMDWGAELELVLINDGSKDKSEEILKTYQNDSRVKVLINEKNIGKSQTIKKGLLKSTGDIVAIQDTDLEYDPNDLLTIINYMVEHSLDVVYGNRFGKNNKIVYYSNWIGNRGLSFFSSLFTFPRAMMWTNDMETCYKAVKGNVFREIAGSISATSSFGLEPEITARLARYQFKNENNRHIKYSELPISYFPRTIAEGKKMKGLSDGLKALIEIIKYNLF